MKVKRLKELLKNVSDDTEVCFMFGLNEKYENKENGKWFNGVIYGYKLLYWKTKWR